MAKKTIDCDLFRLVAHRGLHNESVCENSLKAFELAIEKGLPFEFDLHLSKDGHPVVSHDADLGRMCGKPGYIPSLTLEEIKRDYRLRDGQSVPTLEEVLALNKERVPMVVELKGDKGKKKEIAKKTLPLLSDIKDPSRVCLISFSPMALFSSRRSPFARGLLVCVGHKEVFHLSRLFDFLDVETVLADHPYVVKYRKKGGKVNVWTFEKQDQIDLLRGRVDMVTFQHLSVEDVKKVF